MPRHWVLIACPMLIWHTLNAGIASHPAIVTWSRNLPQVAGG